MTQPPPPYQPYQQGPQGPQPYGAPPKKSNKTLWIVLLVVGFFLFLCCGGLGLGGFLIFKEVDEAIDEERRNDTPTTVEEGAMFEHDDFEVEAGWKVQKEPGAGNFYNIVGLVVTNTDGTSRSANFEFTLYQDDIEVAAISCDAYSIAPDAKAEMECYSTSFDGVYDEVRVADSY